MSRVIQLQLLAFLFFGETMRTDEMFVRWLYRWSEAATGKFAKSHLLQPDL
jgi:hypothetical protein